MMLLDRRDLRGIDEHAAYLGALIGAPHPASNARIGPAAGALPGEDRREIAGGEAQQRVGAVEGGDNNLADLAFADRFAGAWSDDLDDDALIDDHAFERFALIGDNAKIRRPVALQDRHA